MKIKTNDIKKGTKVKTAQLGALVTGIMADNKKGNTRLIDVKGSEVGLFDELNNLIAVGRLSSPINKNFSSEAIVKVRLTY